MHRAIWLLAFTAALPVSGQVGSTALYTSFENQAPPTVFAAIQREVETLMEPGGIHFAWRTLPANTDEVWMDLPVINFKGRCQAAIELSLPTPHDRLGWTHVVSGDVLPFADIDCDAIRSYLQKSLFSLPVNKREAAFGRAVGRVIAHELLHVFARAKSHGAAGVDQPFLSIQDLMADELQLMDQERKIHMVRSSGRPVAPKIGSAQTGYAGFARNGCSSCHGTQAEGSKRGPVLRAAGRIMNSVALAAKLAKHQKKMVREAQHLKLAVPSIAEEDLADVASFLTLGYQAPQ